MATELNFLVVDAFPTMRKLIASLLKELGYGRIYEAEDREIALHMLRTNQDVMGVNFVITDWNMPQMDGLELLRTIRRDPQLSHLSVMIVTAEAKRENIITAAQAGVDGYIVKPFNAMTLKEKIDKIVIKKGFTV